MKAMNTIIQAFCCDITSGTREEQQEFKRLYNKASNKNWGYGTIYYGVDKYGVFDCSDDINFVFNFISKVIPLSEGIEILKKMVGKETTKTDGWISVKDKLPPINVTPGVLVYCIDGSIQVQSVYNNGSWHPTFQKGWGQGESYEVTHWMPIPNPPKP